MSTKLHFLLIIFLFFALCFRLVSFGSEKPKFKEGQKVKFTGVLTAQPQTYQKSQRFNIQEAVVVAPAFPQYFYGNKLEIVGTIKDGVLIFPQIKVLEKGEGSWILRKVYNFRERLIKLFESFLPEPSSSLFLGIFLGVKKTLPKDFYSALRRTGVLHVIVASGMNVAMVASFSLTFLNLILKRRWAGLLTILAIVFYAALSGFDPPIVRAVIMGIIVILGEFFGRLNFRVLSLGVAGYLMLFLSSSLINDLGFQLSFISTAGLMFIKPLFRLNKADSLYLLKDDFLTTFSAQLVTLPILLINFGQYQPLSLLVNTLVLWTTPILMVFGGAVVLGGLIFPPLGQIFAFLAYPFLFYFEKMVMFFGQLPFAEIRMGESLLKGQGKPFLIGISKPSFFFVLGYYFLLTSILIFCYKRR
ncbi:ComEC/Rec2 family competence protein [Candidatus Microgenomates bacterium]|nr:ComEC/Rec2 family competence protein [Candidatus Microgenomates bacterium]